MHGGGGIHARELRVTSDRNSYLTTGNNRASSSYPWRRRIIFPSSGAAEGHVEAGPAATGERTACSSLLLSEALRPPPCSLPVNTVLNH